MLISNDDIEIVEDITLPSWHLHKGARGKVMEVYHQKSAKIRIIYPDGSWVITTISVEKMRKIDWDNDIWHTFRKLVFLIFQKLFD